MHIVVWVKQGARAALVTERSAIEVVTRTPRARRSARRGDVVRQVEVNVVMALLSTNLLPTSRAGKSLDNEILPNGLTLRPAAGPDRAAGPVLV
jgi:hypothetical protein